MLKILKAYKDIQYTDLSHNPVLSQPCYLPVLVYSSSAVKMHEQTDLGRHSPSFFHKRYLPYRIQ